MSVTQLTSGTVFIEDGVNPTPDLYGTARRVNVTINFGVGEGASDENADAVIARASSLAAAQVDTLLGRTATPAAAETRKRRPAAPKETIDEPPIPDASGGGASPDGGDGPTGEQVAQVGGGADVPDDPDLPPPDELADLVGPIETATVITDAELVAVIVRKNEALKDTPRIRAVIASYNPDGTKQPMAALIPQDKRAAFVAELEALK